jgi:multidrug efflux pump subunit AcrB
MLMRPGQAVDRQPLIPVRVRLNDASARRPGRIGGAEAQDGDGAAVPLSRVADVRIAEGPAMVDR